MLWRNTRVCSVDFTAQWSRGRSRSCLSSIILYAFWPGSCSKLYWTQLPVHIAFTLQGFANLIGKFWKIIAGFLQGQIFTYQNDKYAGPRNRTSIILPRYDHKSTSKSVHLFFFTKRRVNLQPVDEVPHTSWVTNFFLCGWRKLKWILCAVMCS